ncbi:MAG: hypothetical protein IKK10_00195 [Clostridia bacterium]|nr:hypothetical protein [Clostridia bacterium]
MKKYKFSKTYVAAVLYRYAFLLFVPVLQGILFAKSGKEILFTLYSADLIVLVLIISIAATRCSKSELRLDNKVCDIRGGVFFKTSEKSILQKRVSLVFTSGIFIRLMGGCRLRIFGGSAYSAAYLKHKDKDDILNILLPKNPQKIVASGIFRSLLMSLSFSNALTGLLAAVPVIRRASVIIGAKQTALILEGASLEGIFKFTGLEPMLSKISSVLFFCWVVGFATEFFSEYGLKLSIYPFHFKVSKGLITKTQAVFSKKSVRAVIFRQSLLMFLLGFYSAQLILNIKPRRKIHILSAGRRLACEVLQEDIYGNSEKYKTTIYPPKTAVWGYTYLPFICVSLSSVILILLSSNLIIKSVSAVMTVIFAIWFLFRFFALFRSSVSISDKYTEVKYYSGMNFTRAVFKSEDITGFEITQSIFQQINGRCNIKIKIANTKTMTVRIKHLNKNDVLKLKFPPLM